MKGDISESKQAWQDCLGLYDTLMRVARETWHIDGVAPGHSFVGLSRLLESVYRARSRDKAKRKGNKKRRTAGTNLLDYLTPVELEQRIVRACPGIIGLDIPQARVLVDAYTLLLDFADRQRLIEHAAAAATRVELVRIRGELKGGGDKLNYLSPPPLFKKSCTH